MDFSHIISDSQRSALCFPATKQGEEIYQQYIAEEEALHQKYLKLLEDIGVTKETKGGWR
jgi:hypothetical protein